MSPAILAAEQASPTGQPVKRDYLSFSAIQTYRQCPLRYYFRYLAGLPEQAVAASLVFGSAMHAAVEHHFRELLIGNPAPALAELQSAYSDAWQQRKNDQVVFNKTGDRAGLDQLAERMLTAFQASDLAIPSGTILGIEEELRGALIPGVPDFLGRLDLLFDLGDSYLLTDLKTAKSRWSREQVLDAGEQLWLYSEMVSQILPDKPIRLQFAVITKAKEPVIEQYDLPNTRAQRERTKQIVERVWHAIEMKTFYPAPSAMNCPSCPFREPCRRWGS